ncbi:MAG: class I SAM-dependent methyltransferase [Myxococcota bacterium]
MRDDRPSLTAAFVAFARGIGVRGEAPDPVAGGLVPAPFGRLLDAVGRSRGLRPALRGMSLGMIDHITLRTTAIDRALRTALSQGTDQVVVLGAGLDARAWRMPELGDADVYEVDHPASQAYKRERVGHLQPLARAVHFVSCDFERERIGDALAASGHDASRPTFWIWEGVTMYLRRASVVASLGVMDERSAPGSELVVTYVLPEYVPLLGDAVKSVVHGVFQAFGEPLIGGVEPEEMAGLLRGAGFDPVSDTDSVDWARAEGIGTVLPFFFRAERLAVARRR